MPRLFVLIIAATLLASCAAHGNIGDYIPHWAGGLPEGTPPRPGTPEYDAFRQKQEAQGLPPLMIDKEQESCVERVPHAASLRLNPQAKPRSSAIC